MLIATDTRKASVHGRLRKPSTKRSEVVNPTSNSPPTISHNQGMTILSLDASKRCINLRLHGQAAHHRQHDRAAALSGVPRGDAGDVSDRISRFPPLGARRDGRV